eukprot:13048250-Alexandrium_andersonii.AAC.1
MLFARAQLDARVAMFAQPCMSFARKAMLMCLRVLVCSGAALCERGHLRPPSPGRQQKDAIDDTCRVA